MKIISTIAVLAVVSVVGAFAFVYSGIYNVAATRQHTAPVYWLLQKALTRFVEVRSEEIVAPDLSDQERILAGLRQYQTNCARCHGAPGVARDRFALGMTPVPPPMVQLGRELAPGEIFWVAKHGLKFTGMPGWEFKLRDEDIWNIVAFVMTMPNLSPVEYYQLAGMERPIATPEAVRTPVQLGNAQRGKVAIRQYGCIACHTIQGVTGPDAWVGPPLRRFSERKYIAGVLSNTSKNLVRWIRNPQAVDPLTAMPALGVTDEHARDIAAYLYSLDQ